MRLAADGVVRDSGQPDPVFASACQYTIEDLPADNAGLPARQPLLRDRPAFRNGAEAVPGDAAGWTRVQAICEFVHFHIAFGYEHARATMTAWEVFNEGKGVPRLCAPRHHVLPLHDHSGALLHRVPQRHRHTAALAAGDFAGWFEAYIGGRGHTFDPRNKRSEDWPRPDRAGARCLRCSDHPRSNQTHRGMDRRGPGDRSEKRADESVSVMIALVSY